MDLEFVPVDLARHEDLCVRFSEDAYVESFGDASKFHEADGKGAERFRAWLREKLAAEPSSSALVVRDSEIIGQITLGRFRPDPSIGYVNLYYLIPSARGRNFSQHLERYAVAYLLAQGHTRARLSVSPTNKRAVRFYEKNGWRDLGPREGMPDLHLMEKTLTP